MWAVGLVFLECLLAMSISMWALMLMLMLTLMMLIVVGSLLLGLDMRRSFWTNQIPETVLISLQIFRSSSPNVANITDACFCLVEKNSLIGEMVAGST